MDLKRLLSLHDFDFNTNALGLLRVGAVTSTIADSLANSVKKQELDGRAFVRHLQQLTCKRITDSESQAGALSNDDVNLLTDDEVDKFAVDFMANNSWLLESDSDLERKETTNQKGERVVSYKPRIIELPKMEGENSSTHLLRLFRRHFDRKRENQKKLLKHATSKASEILGTFSNSSYIKQILQTQELVTKPWQNATSYLERYQSEAESIRRNYEKLTQTSILSQHISRSEALAIDIRLGNNLAFSANIADAIGKQHSEMCDMIKRHEALFRLPQEHEAALLMQEYKLGAVALLAQERSIQLDMQATFAAMTNPWLNVEEAMRSASAIAELQGIGKSIRTLDGFDPDFTTALRIDLGDWRDKITFPTAVFEDPVARTDYYIDRGFNPALTDFTVAAFHEGLRLTGLDGSDLDIELFAVCNPPSNVEEEAGLRRTNKCHDRLQRFERLLRRFIDREMTAQYGVTWPRKKLPPKIFEQWEEKKQKAERNGEIISYIEVADFTDYERIICKDDHWREVFQCRFNRKESVRESLQRLQPIRVASMHARIVTKEDELYLVAEVTRLHRAITR